MIDIKYRVWDKKKKKMYNVLVIDWSFKCIHVVDKGVKRYIDFKDGVLMRYVGKDIHKKDMYVGDIVLTEIYNGEKILHIFEVNDDRILCINIIHNNEICGAENCVFRINNEYYMLKGNRYESPELIGGKE